VLPDPAVVESDIGSPQVESTAVRSALIGSSSATKPAGGVLVLVSRFGFARR